MKLGGQKGGSCNRGEGGKGRKRKKKGGGRRSQCGSGPEKQTWKIPSESQAPCAHSSSEGGGDTMPRAAWGLCFPSVPTAAALASPPRNGTFEVSPAALTL